MNEKPIEETFGNYLTFFRNQTKGEDGKYLSMLNFAEAVNRVNPDLMINDDTIYKLEKGTRKITTKKRDLLLAFLQVLVKFGGIRSREGLDYLVKLSGLKALETCESENLPPYQVLDIAVPTGYSGSYEKSQDPMNLSLVDSFCRSEIKPFENEIGGSLGDLILGMDSFSSLSSSTPPLFLLGLVAKGIKLIFKKKS